MNEPRNIGVFLPNWVGDVVMATPALRALRHRWPEARITLIGKPTSLQTLEPADFADAMFEDISRRRPRWVNFFRMIRWLRAEAFDLAVLMPNSFRSALLAKLGRAKRRAGYDRDGRGWLLTDKLAPQRDENGKYVPLSAVEYYITLVESLGAVVTNRTLALNTRAKYDARAEELMTNAKAEGKGPWIMLNPGAAFGPSKLWAAERYASVADALVLGRGARIIINAAPAERPTARMLADAMGKSPAINLADVDNSLGLVKALLKRCNLLITNDTGARHLAAGVGASVVTIFGSTDTRWSEIPFERERIVRVDVPCSPCQQKRCPQPEGSPQYHQCMAAISPPMVLSAAEELLDLACGDEGGES